MSINKMILPIQEALVGTSTEASIHSGVVHGVLLEIEGTIEAYQNKYSSDWNGAIFAAEI